VNILCPFYQNCSGRSRGIVLTISDRMNERDSLKHNAFAD